VYGNLDVCLVLFEQQHPAWQTIKEACGKYYREAEQQFPKHTTYTLKNGQLGRRMQYELQYSEEEG
jgi:hypothetical protein